MQAMKPRAKNSHRTMQVVLGSQTIKAFVAAPKEFKVIGIVRLGLEFGLLATTTAGHYVSVNGSTVAPLDRQEVEAAIELVCATGRGESYAATRSQKNGIAPPPTVVVRKRRRPLASVGAASGRVQQASQLNFGSYGEYVGEKVC